MDPPLSSESDSGGHSSDPPPEPSFLVRLRVFVFRVVSKASEDNIYFMAGAIAFNLLVALVPLILLFIGVSGYVLNSRFPEVDPASVLIPFILGNLPSTGTDVNLVEGVEGVINTLVGDRTSISVVGLLIFLWISTRLVGTLRVALREIFDFSHGRGIIHGKVFDLLMVMVVGVLFLVNMGITVIMRAFENYGVNIIGLQEPGLNFIRQTSAQLLAFGSIWVLFTLVYRYFPPRRLPWRTALVGATFTGILFELTKYLFSWYVTSVADYRSAYGGLTSAVVLFLWIYYGSIVFILGGEVAQVYHIDRTRKLHATSPGQGHTLEADRG